MRRTFLTVCAAALVVFGAAAQQIPLDSLRAVWMDTTLSIRQRVGYLAHWMDRDSTVTVQQATFLVTANTTDTGDVRYVRQHGLALLACAAMNGHNREWTKALPSAKEALRFAQRGGDPLDVALAHTYLGAQFSQVGLSSEAVQHYLLALEGYEPHPAIKAPIAV